MLPQADVPLPANYVEAYPPIARKSSAPPQQLKLLGGRARKRPCSSASLSRSHTGLNHDEMIRPILLFLLILAPAHVAEGEPTDRPGDELYDECATRANNAPTRAAWASCSREYLERVDKKLNVAWKRTLASVHHKQSRLDLVAEQRAWMRYSTSACKYLADEAGIDGRLIHYPLCRAKVIDARIANLDEIWSQHQDQSIR